MKRWLNKEYLVKRKMWAILLEVVIDSIICAVLLYYFTTKYNSDIVRLLTSIDNNNLGSMFTKIMFPIILVIVTTIKIFNYIIGATVSVEKSNKKKKK